MTNIGFFHEKRDETQVFANALFKLHFFAFSLPFLQAKTFTSLGARQRVATSRKKVEDNIFCQETFELSQK